MIPLLFFCSGATALVYEVIWSRYLSLIFGSTIQAQTVVLAAFMGGLALGNRLFGRRADSLKHPLEAYGYIEFAIGIYAFAFDSIYDLMDGLFIRFGANLIESPHSLLLLKGALSAAMLLGPTILMGGTLPLMAAWLQRRGGDAGRRSARFYAINSLGAVAGAALAGFYLVEKHGMVSSVQSTALVNATIGIAAVLLSRFAKDHDDVDSGVSTAALPHHDQPMGTQLISAGLLVAFTGGVSMGLEVLASRALTLVFGTSLHAFAVVLIGFISGIGLGSAIVSSPRFGSLLKPSLVIYLLLATSYWIGMFVLTLERWAVLYAQARTGLAETEMGYVFNQILTAAIALIALGLPAAMLGSVLPISIRLLSGSWNTLGDCVGRLLTWNTLGAVVGVLISGFVLMPIFGLRTAFLALAIMLSAASLVAARLNRLSMPVILSSVLTALLLWISLSGRDRWHHALSSGIFRNRMAVVPNNYMEQRRALVDIVMYEDAADATVSVEMMKANNPNKEIVLRTNGKPEASTEGDLSTQFLVAHLPMMMKPDSKEVFLLGLGSGITGGAALNHPIDHLTIAENCEPILHAAKLFEPWNRDVLHEPRTLLYHEDGRTVLKLSPKKYDVIISEPSNPWVAGVGSVFTREYYQLAANKLNEGGIMVQWFHIYEMQDDLVFLVLRTFADAFPHMEIWDTQEGDIVMLGSLRPWESSPAVFRKVFERPAVREDLEKIGLASPEAVWARQMASQHTVHAIVGAVDGPLQTDRFPILEYAAPRAFFIGEFVQQLFQFDERTWQMAFASEEKRKVLAALPPKAVDQLLAEYTFSNRELFGFLEWTRKMEESGQASFYASRPYMPVIFRPTRPYPPAPELSSGASAELRTLADAEAQLANHPDQWEEATQKIHSVLKAHLDNPQRPDHTDWEPAKYVVLAAKTRLMHNDIEGTIAALETLFPLAGGDPQALFVLQMLKKLSSDTP